MSKIKAELMKAAEITHPMRKEENHDFLVRLIKGVTGLDDGPWEALSQPAKDWFNDAVDAMNAKAKELPPFPDAETAAAKDEPKTASRRGAKAETKAAAPKVGDDVTVLTKRGKSVVGEIVELDDEVVVIDVDGKEEEFDLSRVESITINGGKTAAKDEDEAEDGPAGPKVGDDVTVVTKRGKEITGKIVEIDDEIIVLDVDGKEEEFDQSRIETIKAVAAKAEPKASGRRGAKAEPKDEDEADAKAEKPKRSSNGEVSIGTRIKELIAADLEATEADIAKILKKEGLEFRENTLKLNYTDAHKFIVILKAAKLIKK